MGECAEARYPHEAIVSFWYSVWCSQPEVEWTMCREVFVGYVYKRSCSRAHACPRVVWLDLAYVYLVMNAIMDLR